MHLKALNEDLNSILKNTTDLWFRQKNKTIFVSGGTGFFGIWLIMSFVHINKVLNLNSKMVILTRDINKFFIQHPWLRSYSEIVFIKGNIINFKFPEIKIDYIIHAATDVSVQTKKDKIVDLFDTLVLGTKRILEFARHNKVESFLLTSSGAVYGKQPENISHIEESFIGGSNTQELSSVYAEGKRISEMLCSIYYEKYNLPVKIARCFAFVGPFLKLDSHFAIGNFINNILNSSSINIKGNTETTRSYMYSSDLCIWLWTILFKGEINRPYNVGSDEEITILDLAKLILKEDTTKKLKINTLINKSEKSVYVPSIERAKKELNLKLNFSLKKSIKKTINHNLRIKKT